MTSDDELGVLDLSMLQPVPQAKMLAAVNHYVSTMIQFINKFASNCETRLAELHSRIQALEILVSVLEAKLSSIEWLQELDTVQQSSELDKGSVSEESLSTPAPESITAAPLPPTTIDVAVAETSVSQQESPEAIAISEEPEEVTDKLKDDETYGPWFKRLRLRIPKAQLQMQMKVSGLNGAILE